MGSQKIFDPFIVWVQKYFFPINVELNKICWLIRIFGSKKEWAKNNSGKNFLIKNLFIQSFTLNFGKKMSEKTCSVFLTANLGQQNLKESRSRCFL